MPGQRSKQPSPQSYHHGQLREALIHAALHILDNEGIAALTLRKTARVAGVSHAAPAHHFGDINGLLAAVATQHYRALHHAMFAAYKATRDVSPRERLLALGLAYINTSLEQPRHFRILLHPLIADPASSELARIALATFDILVVTITEGQTRGGVKPGAPRELALFAWATLRGLAELATARLIDRALPNQSPDDLAQAVNTHLVTSLAQVHPTTSPRTARSRHR